MNEEFFNCSTVELAQKLLGMNLVNETFEGKTVGKIIEVEAYLFDDPASHSFNGKTPRNSPMFEKAGMIYVYFIYGTHYCFNIVSNKEGVGEAILIRALEPVEGMDLMKRRRGKEDLCNGPAKLVQAMGITKEDNMKSLVNGNFRLEEGYDKDFKIVKSKRIGITKGKSLKLRFYLKGNKFVSDY